MLPTYFVYFGLALQLVGQISYIRTIFYGKTRPNLITWFMWMVAPFIGFFFQLKAGGGLSVLPVFMAGFGPMLVIIFSTIHHNSFWKLNSFDLWCGFLSAVALIFYAVTHNLGVSIFFAILSDALAGVPTYIKSWTNPESENTLIYLFALISNVIGLLTLTVFSFSTVSFGLYIAVQCAGIILCIYRKQITSFFSRTLPQS